MAALPESIGGYKIVRELGRGAMGTVYLAHQESLGRDMAIKVMAAEFVREEEFIERFRREGRIAAKLRHPNIVQVYDFGERDGFYYIAMEYLGSSTLKSHVQELGRLEISEAGRLADQLLAALEHAHSVEVVHRDIKPANIMITDQGDAALTDFSIAQMKSATKLTATGAVLGTPEYMAPEQFEGKADGRSDLYSAGIILYEMLTGFSPFHAETIAEIMKKQLFVAPDPPSLVDFTIPEALSQVVVKSLAKVPEERFQSASQMRAALKAALTSPVEDKPTAPKAAPPITPPPAVELKPKPVSPPQVELHPQVPVQVVAPPEKPPEATQVARPEPATPSWVTAVEQDGQSLLLYISLGCCAMATPLALTHKSFPLGETLYVGGLLGATCLLVPAMILSLFYLGRRHSIFKIISPFFVLAGVWIWITLAGFKIVQNGHLDGYMPGVSKRWTGATP